MNRSVNCDDAGRSGGDIAVNQFLTTQQAVYGTGCGAGPVDALGLTVHIGQTQTFSMQHDVTCRIQNRTAADVDGICLQQRRI